MKKITRLITLALVFAVLFALGSCQKKDESIPDGFKLANAAAGEENVLAEGQDYFFYVPAAWTVDINNTATSAYVSTSEAATVSVMTWTSSVTDAAPGDFWETFIEDFKKVYSDFEIESEEDMLLDGEAARSVIFVGSIAENTYRFRQVTAVRNSMIYVLTYTNLASNFEDHDGDFDDIVSYFKFS